MPYIETKLSIPLSVETEAKLKTELGRLIENFPGKSESWLMLDFSGSCHMYFKGSDEPCAMVKVSIFGKATSAAYDKMTKDICDLISGETGISSSRIYVKYEEVSNWGWNGSNF